MDHVDLGHEKPDPCFLTSVPIHTHVSRSHVISENPCENPCDSCVLDSYHDSFGSSETDSIPQACPVQNIQPIHDEHNDVEHQESESEDLLSLEDQERAPVWSVQYYQVVDNVDPLEDIQLSASELSMVRHVHASYDDPLIYQDNVFDPITFKWTRQMVVHTEGVFVRVVYENY